MRTFRKLAAAVLFGALLAGVERVASSAEPPATGLSVAETERLLRGTPVVHPVQLERAGRRYVGGVSYVVVDAAVEKVASLLGDVGSWQRILPKTRAADVVGSAGDDDLVLITHGTALLQASYTMRVHREGRSVRFWMDPGHRHDIEDAWGFLRVAPLGSEQSGQTVLTYGVLVDLGPGLLRDLFEERVRELALSVPDRVRWMVVSRNAAGQRASR